MINMVVATTLKYLVSNEIPDEKERIIKIAVAWISIYHLWILKFVTDFL